MIGNTNNEKIIELKLMIVKSNFYTNFLFKQTSESMGVLSI